MNTEDVKLDTPLSDYDAAMEEIIKMLDFLPDNEAVRRQYVAMAVSRLLTI